MNSFFKKFIIGEWNLGICNQNFLYEFQKIKKGDVLSLNVKWMKHHCAGSFFADPFIYSVDNERARILAEEFIYSRTKGIISLCTIERKSGKLINRNAVLEENCHLSYPFYDAESGRFAPESCRNGNWATYKFDGERAYDKKIICNESLIDATPMEWNGRWYIFAVKQPRALDQLLIFSADSKYGNYLPHPLNPIKDCIKTSRCGGKCFVFKGELYRLVQDSTNLYGECMHITHVTNLTANTFDEEHWCDIKIKHNGKYSLGMHTLNFENDFIVIDGYREKMRPFFATYMYKIVPILRRLKLHK